MGTLVATGVHLSRGSNPCLASLILVDNAPAYNPLNLVTFALVAGNIVTGHAENVQHEVPTPPNPATPGTWHYAGECPYVNG